MLHIIKLIRIFITITLLVMSITIVGSTILFEDSPHIKQWYDNYICFPNYVYYTFAIVLLFVLLIIPYRCKNFLNYASIVIIILLIISSISIALWIPSDIKHDHLHIHQLAVGQTNASQIWYFYTFPFNLHATTLFRIIYKITHYWRFVILTESLFTLSACILTSFSVYNITHSRFVSITTFTIATLLLCVNLRSATPHTNCSAMLCHTAAFFLYTTNIRKKIKYPLIVFFIAIGAWLKITSLIIIISIIIIELTYNYKSLYHYKNIIINISCAIVLLILLRVLPILSYNFYNFTPEPNKELRMSWFFYFGQNTLSYGTTSDESKQDWKYAGQFTTLKERDKALWKGGFSRISERGISGNIKFYIKKLIVSYRDALFVNQEYQIEENDYNKKIQTPLGQIMLSHGRFFQFYAGLNQTLWNTILLLLLASPLFLKKNTYVVSLIFIGMNLYILLFENRACYVYMFVPYMIILAMYTLYQLKHRFVHLHLNSLLWTK